MAEMFAGYNKGNKKGTLTGNWVEEEALRRETGYSRYQEWVPTDEKTETFSVESTESKSFRRVIAHSDSQNPKGYRSSSKVDRPATNQEHQLPPSIGRRAQLQEQRLYERAKQLESQQDSSAPKEDSNVYKTTASLAFQAIDPQYLIQQPRAEPRGKRGGKEIPKDIKDLTKLQLDDSDKGRLSDYQGPEYMKDTAVSIYSHSMQTGAGLNFSVSAASASNPFSKSTAFTNDIRDGRKTHGEATNPGELNAERTGATIHQRSALEKLKKMFSRNGNLDTDLTATLLEMDQNGNRCLSYNEFVAGIGNCGMQIPDFELKQIFMFFDRNGDGKLDIKEFLATVKQK